jgi:hypothetical protein
MRSHRSAELLVSLALGAALTMSGCATTGRALSVRAPDAQPVAKAEEYPLIVRLVGRHYEVSVSSSPTGVVYSAAGTDGRLVVANATLEELRERHPHVYQQIIPGIAEKRDESTSNDRTADDANPSRRTPVSDVRQPARGGRLLMLHAAN